MCKDKVVHFSIDDVNRSLRYIYRNNPNSIFDLTLYGTLQRWHEQYGLKVSMYCISQMDDFNIASVPIRYSGDFSGNKDWLRFGFHSSNSNPFIQDDDYERGFDNVYENISKWGAGQTNIIRLHSWLASTKQKKWLFNQGIETIFYPNNDRYHYDADGCFYDCGLKHQVTKVRMENIIDINDHSVFIGDKYISCFTHEWCFINQINRIEMLLKMYINNGYTFV